MLNLPCINIVTPKTNIRNPKRVVSITKIGKLKRVVYTIRNSKRVVLVDKIGNLKRVIWNTIGNLKRVVFKD